MAANFSHDWLQDRPDKFRVAQLRVPLVVSLIKKRVHFVEIQALGCTESIDTMRELDACSVVFGVEKFSRFCCFGRIKKENSKPCSSEMIRNC